ncbi:hypothetical protein Slala05_83310 [Streptomyces lavendulae subsp. lavendulae]|nr:hypothetical protein Slala05_83310 [Streptomyces lavendulae subsp. lavendulae]
MCTAAISGNCRAVGSTRKPAKVQEVLAGALSEISPEATELLDVLDEIGVIYLMAIRE